MCSWKLLVIVVSLQLASERATSTGLVLVLFSSLFMDKSKGKDTIGSLQCLFTSVYTRVEIFQSCT